VTYASAGAAIPNGDGSDVAPAAPRPPAPAPGAPGGAREPALDRQCAGCAASGNFADCPAWHFDPPPHDEPAFILGRFTRETGKLAGSARTERKRRAAKANGRRGGRPKKTERSNVLPPTASHLGEL
jgi:hypothetical protein